MLQKATAFGNDYDNKGANIKVRNLDKSKPVFGIDLGTTNSAISVIMEGSEPKTIQLVDGRMTMPSCVMLKDGRFIVGREAYEHRGEANVVYSVKRLMQDPEATVNLKDGEKTEVFTPAEISAEILRGLVEQTGGVYGDIEDVIVTVPAYFDQNGVNATKTACEMAGLNLLGIANEPTAASLCYDLKPEEGNTKDVLVYDLGGGTFDTTLMRIQQGGSDDLDAIYGEGSAIGGNNSTSSVVTLGIRGDMHLGGDDIDSALLKIIYKRLKDDGFDVTKIPPLYKENMLLRLEGYKKAASAGNIFEMSVKCTSQDGYTIDDTISVQPGDFKKAAEIIFARTKKIVDELLRATPNKANTIVLTGGSTKSKWIQSCLQEAFPSYTIDCALDPDLSVSQGAAIQGNAVKFGNESVQIFDILPLTIGVRDADGVVEPLIKGGTPLPVTRSVTFTTDHDDQEQVTLHIMQGSTKDADECVSLGSLHIDGIKKQKAGMPVLVVSMLVTANRYMVCTAQIDGIEKKLELDLSGEIQKATSSNGDSKIVKRMKGIAKTLNGKEKAAFTKLIEDYELGNASVLDLKKFVRTHREEKIEDDSARG